MSADVVNLNRARKARDRWAVKVTAAENRVRHGLSKAERRRLETEAAAEARRLDGARREPEGR